MPKCPNGHRNPKGEQVCQRCDALIVADAQDDSTARRLRWIIASTSGVAVILAGLLAVLMVRSQTDTDSAPTTADRAALQQWLSTAAEPIEELQDALADSERALQRVDKPAMEAACRQIHDSAAVGIQAHMPTPDPRLTAELAAAIEDFHSAAHMCLAVVAGSMNSYDGEFLTTLDEAEEHLNAALDLLNMRRRTV